MGGLAVVRSLDAPQRLATSQEREDYEQELVDQYLLAAVGAGQGDSTVGGERTAIFEFIRFLGRPVWTARPQDADRFLAHQRKELGRARLTVQHKAWALAHFFDFLVIRYQGDIHALTGHVVEQVIDEFNRPAQADYGELRIPPSDGEVEALFGGWRQELPQARKYLTAARDYLAASLWRRAGLRIAETYMLDVRDWRRDLGQYGKIHVRFGKGSKGRGPKTRLVPAIDQVDALLDWWLREVRHQFGDNWTDPDAPLLPSERRDPHTGFCGRIGDQSLRDGLAAAVREWLPGWKGRLTPHTLRHYCASSLYARGMDLKAIQELLGHSWLSTTTRYINPRELHQTGVIREVCPGTKGRNEVPTAHLSSFVTSGYATTSPSDARSARQPEKIINEDERVSRIGERARRSQGSTWLPGHPLRVAARGVRRACAEESLPNGPFGWLEYLSPPVHVHADPSSTPGPRSTSGSPPGSGSKKRGETVRWNLRMKAAERGIWKSTLMRRLLAEAGLEISAGKMSALWTGTPTTIRLDDLDVICAVLDCAPTDLLICEPDKVAARRPAKAETGTAAPITPVLGRHRSQPPA